VYLYTCSPRFLYMWPNARISAILTVTVSVFVHVQSSVLVYVAKCSHICHGWRTGCNSLDDSCKRPKTKGRQGSKILCFFNCWHAVLYSAVCWRHLPLAASSVSCGQITTTVLMVATAVHFIVKFRMVFTERIWTCCVLLIVVHSCSRLILISYSRV